MGVLCRLDLSDGCASLQRNFAPLASKQRSLRGRRVANCLERSLLRGSGVVSHLLTSFRWGQCGLTARTRRTVRAQPEAAAPNTAAHGLGWRVATLRLLVCALRPASDADGTNR